MHFLAVCDGDDVGCEGPAAVVAEQVAQAYPMLDEFFALKKRYDPEGRFRNSIYDRFA